MRKEQITNKEAICLLMLFTMGSTLILGTGGEAKNDAWISGIIGIIMAVPMITVYSRILSLFPGKDLFEILDKIFGKVIGKLVSSIYILYSFHLGALIIRNFGEFINTVAMPETPILVPMFGLGLLCIMAVKLGVEELGRFSTYLFPLLLFIIIVINILGIPDMEFHKLKPILGSGLPLIFEGAFETFSFPFAETVLFMGVFFSLKSSKSSYKVYYYGIMGAGAIIVTLTIRNIIVLGGVLPLLYFPSYVAVGRIRVGDFLQRMEVTVSIVFVVCAFIKSSICLMVASRGIANIFSLKNYRTIVIQLGLLMIYFSYTVYDNIMVMRFWAFKVYEYYAFPMQVILPLIIWVTGEFKARKRSK